MAEEKHRLLPLPDPMPATYLVEPALVDKTAFAHFDTNIYSHHLTNSRPGDERN